MLTNMHGMNQSMEDMNQNMQLMNLTSTDAMRYEMGDMSDSMRPMGRMNNFMPW